MTIYELPFEKVDHQTINQTIKFKAVITKIHKPELNVKTGLFECRSCMRLHEVPQSMHKEIYEPAVCMECGGRDFKLLRDESEFRTIQYLELGTHTSSKKLRTVLEGDLISYDDYHIGTEVIVQGECGVETVQGKFELLFHCIHIEITSTDSPEMGEIEETDGRKTPEYNTWRQTILKRDNICQICGGNKHLEAHHIFGYKKYPSLRLNEGNGVTLCKFCHNKFHSYYGKNVTPVELIKFIRKFRRL